MSCSLTLICSFDSKLQLGRLYLVLIVCQLYGGGERNNDEVCQRVLYWCCDVCFWTAMANDDTTANCDFD